MVFDPDTGLVTDIVACEDAHESERTAGPLWWRALGQVSDGLQIAAQYLLHLASQVSPRRVVTCKRGPKKDQPKPDVDAAVVRKHLSTALVLRDAKVKTA